MTPSRRRAALRVGGAVISASLLLLVERCAQESRPASRPSAGTARVPGRPSHVAIPPPPTQSAQVRPGPMSGSLRPQAVRADGDTALHGLVAALPGRERSGLVAAPIPAPIPANVPANDPGRGAEMEQAPDRPAPPTGAPASGLVAPLHDLLPATTPREPLLGLAATPVAGPTPDGTAAMAGDRAVPPRAALTDRAAVVPGFANDNAATLPDAPPALSPAPSPPPSPAALATATASAPVSGVPDAAPDSPTDPSPGPVTAWQPADLASSSPAAHTMPPAEPEPRPAPVPSRAVDAPSAGPAQPPPPAPSASPAGAATAQPAISPTTTGPKTSGIAAAPAPLTGFSDDDELILELTTPRRELSGTIIAYNRGGVPYLPLGEIARLLDLAVTVSDGGRYAAGWVLDPARTVTLNLRDGTLTVAGETRKLAPDDAAAFDGELYLRADRFADLFPLTLTPNLRAQTVTLQTRVPFPFEERLARETARDQLQSRQGRRDGHGLPRVATPWRLADVPLLDSELRLASDTNRGTRAEADLHLAGDLAWLTARSFLSLDTRGGLTAARLELGRRDPDGALLGPLGATAFGLGDVTSTPLAMGPASVAGRGAYIGNAPLERASVFDRIELRGDMPAGFEAELYRNNVLIDTATRPEGGQYRFLNVPVEFGLNLFRVVLYGPQGQRREIVRQVSVGDGRLGPGELVYSASAVQKNRSLFDLQGRDYIQGPDDGALRTAAEVQYGFTGGLTGTLGGAVYDRFGTRHWLATGGLRTGFAGFAVKLDLGLGDGASRALGLGVARKLGGFSVTLNHAEYGGRFVDEVRSFSDQPLRRATELTINGALALGGEGSALRIPVNGLARNVVYADGRQVLAASLTQTVPLARALQLSNLVEFNRTSQPLFGTTTQLRGSFDLTTLSRRSFQLRAGLGYTLAPTAQITAAALQVDRRIGVNTTLSASAGHTFQAGQNRFGLAAIRRFERFSLALDGAWSSRPNQYAAMLRLSFSLGRNPLDGRLFMAQPGLAGGGAVALHAFRDLDGDGRYTPGEPPLPEVRFFAGSENRATDADGRVLLGRLGDGPRTSVRIDADSLPDINLAPATAGIELAPRAGRIHVAEFAVRALGELDGTALFRTAAGEKGVSGVVVLLRDPTGKIAARTRTGADGAFWFEKLTPGRYAVTLDAAQSERLGVRLAVPVTVMVGNDGEASRTVLHLEAAGAATAGEAAR